MRRNMWRSLTLEMAERRQHTSEPQATQTSEHTARRSARIPTLHATQHEKISMIQPQLEL